MKEKIREYEELGEKLRELCIKYNEDYFTIAYVNGDIQGNNSPYKPVEEHFDIFLPEKESEE